MSYLPEFARMSNLGSWQWTTAIGRTFRNQGMGFRRLLMVLLVAAWMPRGAEAGPNRSEPAPFEFGTYLTPAAGPELGSIEVFVALTNDQLQFVKKRGKLSAEYTVAVDVLAKDGTRIKGESVKNRRTATAFAATNDKLVRWVSHVRFEMPAGRYQVIASVRDQDLNRETHRRTEVEVFQYDAGELGLSDVILLGDRDQAAAGRFSDFQSLYFDGKADPGLKIYAVFRVVGGPGSGALDGRALFRRPTGEVARDVQFTVPAENAWRFVELGIEGLPSTKYGVEVRVVGTGGTQATSSRQLAIRSAGMSALIPDLEEGIEQLLYVADKSDRDRMRDAQGEEKRKLFEAFWKQKDPSPGTPDNELMVEYYHRVHEADLRFRCYKAGWKTDRGWVFITHGEPNEIERFPFELDSHPYEVWTYYNPDRRFVFIDRNGFGDYDMAESEGGNFRFGID